jgi:homocysteine S-methyltransferase
MFDIDAIGLVNVVNRLNHGFDVGDNPIGEPTSFFAGGLATVGAPLPEEELSRLAWKVDAGAEFVVTSPVFDVRALGKFLERADAVRVPVIATIEPLRSHRHAEHLAAEVPGVDLPAGILERMAAVPEQDQAAVGLEIARELIDEIRPLVEGILLSGPRAKDESSWALLENLFGSEVPVRREFRGRPGVMGSSESTRYEEERPPS